VTRDDLREVRELGWLERALFGVGTFFFSGAFWLVFELLAHQDHTEFNAWIGMCLLSIGIRRNPRGGWAAVTLAETAAPEQIFP
jgi:hypothetical protein